MNVSLFQWGQLLTLLMIAFALGMDAFSLGIGVGMAGMRLSEIVRLSVTIGLFHVGMPLLGIVIGMKLSALVGDVAVLIGGGVLMALGVHMLWSGVTKGTPSGVIHPRGLGLFLFAFSVSLDALSVGVSFGLIAVNKLLAVSLFGMMGGLMAGCGLLLGRHMAGWLGEYSEMLGGLILLAFGLKFVL